MTRGQRERMRDRERREEDVEDNRAVNVIFEGTVVAGGAHRSGAE